MQTHHWPRPRSFDWPISAYAHSPFSSIFMSPASMSESPPRVLPLSCLPLEKVPGIGSGTLRRFGRGIHRAIRKGIDGPPLQRPVSPFPKRARPSNVQVKRLASLKVWRTNEAKTLDFDTSLVWPMRSLERLAREPGTLQEEQYSPEVRNWQREQFGESLKAILATEGLPN